MGHHSVLLLHILPVVGFKDCLKVAFSYAVALVCYPYRDPTLTLRFHLDSSRDQDGREGSSELDRI